MKQWTDQSASEELRTLIQQTDSLQGVRRRSAPHVEWLYRSIGILDEIFGQESSFAVNLSALPWGFVGQKALYGRDVNTAMERLNQEAYVEQLDTAKGILRSALLALERKGIAKVRENSASDQTVLVYKIIELATKRLRKLIRSQPTSESDIQERFQDLLAANDIGYTREAETVVYSSKSYRPDFVIAATGQAIELKLCAKPGREKEIIAEINDDILAYRQRWSAILFIVYDCGQIRDADKFLDDLKRHDGVLVEVVKH